MQYERIPILASPITLKGLGYKNHLDISGIELKESKDKQLLFGEDKSLYKW